MVNEAKPLGILLIVVALVWGFNPIMDRVKALTVNGGIWAVFPDIIPLVLVGGTGLIIVIGIVLLWEN